MIVIAIDMRSSSNIHRTGTIIVSGFALSLNLLIVGLTRWPYELLNRNVDRNQKMQTKRKRTLPNLSGQSIKQILSPKPGMIWYKDPGLVPKKAFLA